MAVATHLTIHLYISPLPIRPLLLPLKLSARKICVLILRNVLLLPFLKLFHFSQFSSATKQWAPNLYFRPHNHSHHGKNQKCFLGTIDGNSERNRSRLWLPISRTDGRGVGQSSIDSWDLAASIYAGNLWPLQKSTPVVADLRGSSQFGREQLQDCLCLSREFVPATSPQLCIPMTIHQMQDLAQLPALLLEPSTKVCR